MNFSWGKEFVDEWFGCKENNIYWFGLTPDGRNAYVYDNLKDFKSAKVFNDKSLEEIWNKTKIFSDKSSMPIWYYEEKAKTKLNDINKEIKK